MKIKPVIVCALAAFVFSLFTALLSRSGFPTALLKAFIFSVVFGALSFAVQILYGKFLAEDASSVSDTPPVQNTVGTKVDLVVSEEDLPGEGDGPSFVLDSARHILTNEDIEGSPAAPARTEAVPVSPVEAAAEQIRDRKAAENIVASVVAQKARRVSEEAVPAENSPQQGFVPLNLASHGTPSGGAKMQDSDALPEIDDLPSFENVGDSGEDGESVDVIEDSDFAVEGTKRSSHQTEFPDGKIADSKDSALMAKAIQTVLKKGD